MNNSLPLPRWSSALLSLMLLLAVVQAAAGKAPATSYSAYTAYRTAIAHAGFLAPLPGAARLLSDAQFAGRLSAGTALLGVYYGNQGWNMDQVRDMEGWQAKKFAVVHLYTNWCDSNTAIDDLFEHQLVNVWNNGNVPLISWEPFLCSPERTPGDVEVRAAQGRYDSYVGRWAERLRGFLSGPDGVFDTLDDRRVFLRLGHEMNGDWVPWSAAVGRNTPADYVLMWRRAWDIFHRYGLDAGHVQWLWSVNHTDNGPFRAEQYYPGDAYVDWMAISGYNWGETENWSNWSTPEQVYGDMIGRLRSIASKPLAIPEYASTAATDSGPDAAAKSSWITSVHRYVLAQDIRLVAWFNEDKETDWAVFGGSRGDDIYHGVGRPFLPPRAPRFQPVQLVAATMLVVFGLVQISFVMRRYRRAKI